jgi:MFS family permease
VGGRSIAETEPRAGWQQLLTAGELGASAAQTTVVAVLPLVLRRYASSNFWIGFAVGGEGVFALLLPFWIGVVSDRMRGRLATRFGRRMLPLLIAAPVMALAVAATPFAPNYWLMVGGLFVFFAALHGYLTPLWALMLDSVPDERRARVQGTRGILRALGLGYGLVAAGLLFAVAIPLPFLVAGALVLATTAMTWLAERRVGCDRQPRPREHTAVRDTMRQLRQNPGAAWLLAANALWNGGIDGVRPYVFLYASAVLGLTVVQTSLGLGVLIAGIGIGSAIAGWLGDRFSRALLLQIGTGALVVGFALALLVGIVLRQVLWAALALAAGGFGAASILTIGYPYFAQLVGHERQGQYTGLWVFSVGFGRIVAPMLVGLAIDLGARIMPSVNGYPMMWAAAGIMAIAGWGALWRAARLSARRPAPDPSTGRSA